MKGRGSGKDSTDWITRWGWFTRELESPPRFHRWAAIGALSHVLGRKVWVDRQGYFYDYPGQMIVVLVAQSAMQRKSEAIRQPLRLVKTLPRGVVNILPRKTSPQELLSSLRLADKDDRLLVDPLTRKPYPHCGLIYASEMAAFFSRESFNDQMATQVTDLNDAPIGAYPVKFRSWSVDLWSPCVGGLMATTPTGIGSELPSFVRTAGFFGRCLFIHEETTDRVSALIDDARPDTNEGRDWLLAELNRIAALRGRFRWSDDAARAFKAWYRVHSAKVQRIAGSTSIGDTGYWGRKDNHLCRVAVVLSASEGDSKTIALSHFDEALASLDRIERDFEKVVSETVTSPTAAFDEKILRLLDQRSAKGAVKDSPPGPGWVERSWLLRQVWRAGGKYRLDQCEETLAAAGLIEVEAAGRKIWWRRRQSIGKILRGVTEGGQGGTKEGT